MDPTSPASNFKGLTRHRIPPKKLCSNWHYTMTLYGLFLLLAKVPHQLCQRRNLLLELHDLNNGSI